MINLILGIITAVATLSLFKQADLGGGTCFYFGTLRDQFQCFNPLWYYGLLGFAALISVVGFVQLIQSAQRK